MAFTAACPFCSLLLQNVPDQQAGASTECPRCRNCFTLAVTTNAPSEPAQARRLRIRRKAKALVATSREISVAVAGTPASIDQEIHSRESSPPPTAVQTAPARAIEVPGVPTTAGPGPFAPAVVPRKGQDPALVRMLLAFILAGLSLALSQAPYGRITSVILAVRSLHLLGRHGVGWAYQNDKRRHDLCPSV